MVVHKLTYIDPTTIDMNEFLVKSARQPDDMFIDLKKLMKASETTSSASEELFNSLIADFNNSSLYVSYIRDIADESPLLHFKTISFSSLRDSIVINYKV